MNAVKRMKVEERVGDKDCVHYWKTDDCNVGRCSKPGCGAVKDFGALLSKKHKEFFRQLSPLTDKRAITREYH